MSKITLDVGVDDIPDDLYAEVIEEVFSGVKLEVCGTNIYIRIGNAPGTYRVPVIKRTFGEIGGILMCNYTDKCKLWETVGDCKDRKDSALEGINEFIRVAEELKKHI